MSRVWGWSKGERHGECSSLVNLGKLAFSPGNDGETGQTRAERNASGSCLLSVLPLQTEIQSNQKVISRLVFFAGLFSILLTFAYTNKLSSSTCVESKLP